MTGKQYWKEPSLHFRAFIFFRRKYLVIIKSPGFITVSNCMSVYQNVYNPWLVALWMLMREQDHRRLYNNNMHHYSFMNYTFVC